MYKTYAFLLFFLAGCSNKESTPASEVTLEVPKTRVVFDTDANNELDDQHALAYLLLNGDAFTVEGITVNATKSGGGIDEQYAEAERVLALCNTEHVPLHKGANGSFDEIDDQLDSAAFDGHAAVNFIIEQAAAPGEKLVVIAVGKLTNVALAVKKDPSLSEKIRLVWLGSNYPEPGEYNQDNDTVAMNYLLNTTVPFEMVTVRYGTPSGTDAVKVTREEIGRMMPGVGPTAGEPVTGRHGGTFETFGDYSVNLFDHIDYHGDPPSRALFDMAAVAIVKNPKWAETVTLPAPVLINNQWRERPSNDRSITVWENFDRDAIIDDFYTSMKNYVLATPTQSE